MSFFTLLSLEFGARGALMYATVLTLAIVCCMTTCHAWWLSTKPMEEYPFAECDGKRYWTFNSICCENTIFFIMTHHDECCERSPYNPRHAICCDGVSIPKTYATECPDIVPDDIILPIRGRKLDAPDSY
ncbi:hypothetical protein LSAT2_025137 [Lamellibrachia satsuma]|nr:hypothetical protein LSAT2_025137 [Lamellibrachia satsuma]